ncbi:MAG: DNA-formamidopyrimidine glycosylase family protein [Candidatus Heimdallarchaeaceae archaeon]
MTELPEAKLITKQINEELSGKQIKSAHFDNYNPKTMFTNVSEEEFVDLIVTTKIISSYAKAKWLFIEFNSKLILATSPEMGADILYHENETSLPKKYHLKLDFVDGSYFTLKYSGFLLLKLAKAAELEDMKYPGKLGISPIDPQYSFDDFNSLLEGHKKIIKAALLDDGNLPGVANYYLNDAFYKAKIHPKRKAFSLTNQERKRLFDSIKQVLEEAIKLKGRVERKDLYGTPGKYVRLIGPKNKDSPCSICGTIIEKIAVAGTNNYVCPNCQKLEI